MPKQSSGTTKERKERLQWGQYPDAQNKKKMDARKFETRELPRVRKKMGHVKISALSRLVGLGESPH